MSDTKHPSIGECETAFSGLAWREAWQGDAALPKSTVHLRAGSVAGQITEPAAQLPAGSAPARAPLRRSLFRL